MTLPGTDPDRELVLACSDPEHDRFETAFEELYERYRDRVYSIAYRIVGTTADALDVVQESFSLVFRKLPGFRFDSKFSTWLFRLVVNQCVDHKRRVASRRVGTSDDGFDETVGHDVDPADAAEVTELGDHVHSGLQRLSPKLRAVLVLRYLEGLSYEELADSLGVSLGTVKSRLARAHLAFETVLEGTLDRFDYPVAHGFADRHLPDGGRPGHRRPDHRRPDHRRPGSEGVA